MQTFEQLRDIAEFQVTLTLKSLPLGLEKAAQIPVVLEEFPLREFRLVHLLT